MIIGKLQKQKILTQILFRQVFSLFPENHLLPTEVRKDALQLQKLLEYDDAGAEGQFHYILFL